MEVRSVRLECKVQFIELQSLAKPVIPAPARRAVRPAHVDFPHTHSSHPIMHHLTRRLLIRKRDSHEVLIPANLLVL